MHLVSQLCYYQKVSFLFSDTTTLKVVDIVCPAAGSDKPFRRVVIGSLQKEDQLTDEDWTNLIQSLQYCSHPLYGKTLQVASLGPNPYIFTDFERNVQYNELGLPLGSNTGIALTLGQVFGLKVKILLLKTHDYYDEKNARWVGITGEVSIIFFFEARYIWKYLEIQLSNTRTRLS
jgi:hypothetical protein